MVFCLITVFGGILTRQGTDWWEFNLGPLIGTIGKNYQISKF